MEDGSANWPNFEGFDLNVEDDGSGDDEISLAAAVLGKFGISVAEDGGSGGSLIGIDIKRMDAMQVIQASLFEGMKDGKIYELVSYDDGVKIIEVGDGSIGYSPIYDAESFSYRSEIGGVEVTGGALPSKRELGSWEEILDGTYNKKIWDDAHYLSSACTMPEMKKFCTITYDDPMLDAQWEDGLGSKFGPDSPFENIVSYQHRIRRGTSNEDVEISFNNKANVPLYAGGKLDTLVVPELNPDKFTAYNDDCLTGLGTIIDSGDYNVIVNVPTAIASARIRGTRVNKISSINSVYVIGRQVNYWVTPSSQAEALNIPDVNNTMLWVDFESAIDSVTKLSDGMHYVAGLTTGNDIGISFADRSVFASAGITGLFGDGKTVYIPTTNAMARLSGSTVWKGTSILPLDTNRAVLVNRILVSIGIDTPCVEIVDPKGNANDIARSLSYKIRPIIIKSEPAPVAINGDLVNLEDGSTNNDPTVTQDLTNTDYERKLNDIESVGAGNSFTLSSLNKAETARMSQYLYDLYTSDNGIVTTYTFGPEVNIHNVHPGMNGPSGGVVNKVEARYTDSSSYLITVTEGSKSDASNFGSLSGSTYMKKTSDVSGTGVVVQDFGNGSKFKVLVDGIGPRTAINACSEVIRSGDRVGVLIRNNPVES